MDIDGLDGKLEKLLLFHGVSYNISIIRKVSRILMQDILIHLGQLIRPYQYQCAMAVVATLLVIFGNDINQAVKHLLRKRHLAIRSIVFIVVCAIGYGMLTVRLTGLLSQQFSKIPDMYFAPVLLFVFVVLSIYAQRQRHI